MNNLTFADKMSPLQAEQSKHWAGAAIADLPGTIFRAMEKVTAKAEEKFTLEIPERFQLEDLASPPFLLDFLQILIAIHGARRVLEIGTFVGLSAMKFATAMLPQGRVVTIEKGHEFAAIARRNIAANDLKQQVMVIEGDAEIVLPSLPPDQRFDFVFLDGGKERYAPIFRLIHPLVMPGGVVVVDDALFHCDVLNDPPRTAKGKGVRAMLNIAAVALPYECVLLPIGNGLLLMRKRHGARN